MTRMLIGTFEHMFDAKGRVFIPAKWRETLGEVLVLTQGILPAGQRPCLFGMSQPEWEAFSEKLARLPITDISGQSVRRRLYSVAAACEVDKQGRILIPTALRTVAALDKGATLIGVGNRIEIWDPQTLTAHCREDEAMYGDALEHLAQLGI